MTEIDPNPPTPKPRDPLAWGSLPTLSKIVVIAVVVGTIVVVGYAFTKGWLW